MDYVKIIRGLTTCANGKGCTGCPYEGCEKCSTQMTHDAIDAINELRLKVELQEASGTVKGVVDEATEAAITKMQEEIAAQEQAIETLHEINAKLEGKVEAYESVLRILAKE